MPPVGITALVPRGRRRRLGRVAVEPFGDIVMVILLGPDHAGIGLPLNEPSIRIGRALLEGERRELVGLGDPAGEGCIEIGEGIDRR